MKAIVVMGVAGCGKSSVATACAQRLGWLLVEGDHHHPAANQEKMRSGIALADEDRSAWLDALGDRLGECGHAGEGVVLTCSALKRSYRDRLRASAPGLGFVWLRIEPEQSLTRVAQRAGTHLFPPSLVASQFAALEAPAGEPGVLALDAMRPLPALCQEVLDWLGFIPAQVN